MRALGLLLAFIWLCMKIGFGAALLFFVVVTWLFLSLVRHSRYAAPTLRR